MSKKLRLWAFIILLGLLTTSFYIYINPVILKKLNVFLLPPISTLTQIALTSTPACENRATSTIATPYIINSEPALIVFLVDEIRNRETLEAIFSALGDSLQVEDRVIILSRSEIIIDEIVYGAYPKPAQPSPCSSTTPDAFFYSEWEQKTVSEFMELLRHKMQDYDFYSPHLIDSEELIFASNAFRQECRFESYEKCVFVPIINIQESGAQFLSIDIEADYSNVEVMVIMTDCSSHEAICRDKTFYWQQFFTINNANSIEFVDANKFFSLLKNTIGNKQ